MTCASWLAVVLQLGEAVPEREGGARVVVVARGSGPRRAPAAARAALAAGAQHREVVVVVDVRRVLLYTQHTFTLITQLNMNESLPRRAKVL